MLNKKRNLDQVKQRYDKGIRKKKQNKKQKKEKR